MNIGIIDADLSTRARFNYPNLALMKISGHERRNGNSVNLIGLEEIGDLFWDQYDKVYLSKVFTEPKISIPDDPKLITGGTGLYWDHAEPLPNSVEHGMPDYDLYKPFYGRIDKSKLKYFTDFSIGFFTKGCVRGCEFCVNKNSRSVDRHHNLAEFVAEDRPYIMLWDDNVVAYNKFVEVIQELNEYGKPFIFKQGMDFRLLNDNKMRALFNSNYYSCNGSKGSRVFHFAFDNIADYAVMERKLKHHYEKVKKYSYKTFFYTLTGFDFEGQYDEEFYRNDVYSLLRRIALLFRYSAYPYIMQHENLQNSPFVVVVEQLRRLCNNPMFITNKTIAEAAEQSGFNELLDYLHREQKWALDLFFNSKLYVD